MTTDDCYTPPEVYDVIRDWVLTEYELGDIQIVRPFYPGGDYERYDYPDNCLVLDNPPFSIFSKICSYYLDRNIKFFLFAPALTCLGGSANALRMNHILCDANIRYHNGAVVCTGFVTNLGDGETVLQTAPDLMKQIKAAISNSRPSKQIPKYEYPSNIITAAMINNYCKHGIALKINRADCVSIRALDQQREHKKAIFGGGLLLSDKAAARNAAAKNTMKVSSLSTHNHGAPRTWELSDRERKIVEQLNRNT